MDIDGAVIVIDDDTGAAAGATRALERGGYESVVSTGRSISVDDLETYSCVVTEASFADRDGIDFAARLRTARPGAAIVVYTATGDESIASRAITADVDEYVTKRAGPDELVDAVGRAIERRRRITGGPGPGDERSRRDDGGPRRPGGRREAATDDPECELDRYRTILETVGDMIYALDEEGRITHANHALGGFVGTDPDDVVGTDVAEILPEEGYETGNQLIRTLLETDETDRGRFDFEYERDDGTVRHLENNMAVLFDEEEGTFHGSVGVVRDVTERTEQERLLEHQNARLEEFASIVSHDLRNPLNVIVGRVDLIRETGDLRHLDGIERCVDRMDALLTDLLALAREGKRVNEPEPVSLRAVAVEAWQNVHTANGSLELADDLGIVDADRGRLRQCLENLFRNAFEHGIGDGVAVGVEAVPDGFAVTDDGPGIDADDVEQVFDRGFTTNRQGTGFGLSIVRRIVEAHGWSITVDESHDGGARFVIETDPVG